MIPAVKYYAALRALLRSIRRPLAGERRDRMHKEAQSSAHRILALDLQSIYYTI